MAIIYSYPLQNPKLADLLIGTSIFDENIETSPRNNPTVSFTVQSLLNLIATSTGAQNLQQVTNIGAITTNVTTFSTDIKVTGRIYDSGGGPGAAGQILSSTLVGTQWINNTTTGVTSVSATTAGDALDVGGTPITSSGTLAFTWAGNNTQFVDGGGNLQLISTTYTLPLAADGTRGGVQIGYVENAKNYPVELSTEKMFVNVPWTDTQENTTWYVRDSSDVDKTVNNLKYLKFVTATGSLTTDLTGTGSTGDPFLMTLTSPDTPPNPFQTITGSGSNNTDSGITLSNSGGTVLVLGAGSVTAGQTGNTITLTGVNTWIANAVTVAGYVAAPAALDANLVWKTDGSGNPAWRVDATIPDTGITGVTLLTATSTGAPLGESISVRELTLTSYEYDGGSNVGYVPVGGTGSTYLKGDGTWAAIPTGLQFKGTWDASGGGGGNPDLTAVSPSDGWLYICNVAGTAYPNGGVLPPSAWSLGDWCIYNGTTWTRVPATNAGVTSLTTTDGTYIDLTPNTATTGAVTVTADLSAAATGSCTGSTKFLTEGNKWQVPCYTPTGVTTFTNANGTFISAGTVNTSASGPVTVGTIDLSATGLSGTPATAATQFLRGDNTWAVPDYVTYLAMTTATLGLGKLRYTTGSTPTAETQSTTADRTYGITENASNQLVVNVPWVDPNPFQTITGTGTNNTNSGVLLSNSGGTVLVLGATGVAASQTGNTITLTGTTYALSGVGTDNTDSGIRLTGTGTSAANTDVLILGSGATTVSQTGNTITINSAAGSYEWTVKDNQGSPVSKTLANTDILQFVMASHASAPTAVLTDTGGVDPYIMTLTGKDTTYSVVTTSVPGLAPTLPASAGGKFLKADATWEVPAYIPDTQNEYANSWVQSTNDILLRLTESGAGSGSQDIKIVKGANITFTYTDVNNFTISADNDNDNTTYTIDVPTATTNINLKSSTGVDDAIALTAGTNITIVRNNASQLTFSSTDTNDNYYVTGGSFNTSNGELSITGNNVAVGAVIDLDGRYLTSYTETDTLQNVCSRGNSTSTAINMTGSGASGYLYVAGNSASANPTNVQGMAFAYNNSGGSRENELFFNPGSVTAAANDGYYFAIINEYLNSAAADARVTDTLVKLYGNGNLELVGPASTSTIANTYWRMPKVAGGGGQILARNSSTIQLDWVTPTTGTVTSVSGTGTVSGLTLTGTVNTASPSGNLTLGGTLSLTSGNITSGLGFTPYNATNPAGYTTNTGTTTASNSQTFTNKSGNISQWTNDSGYITSYTETDTLATVTGRGATTATACSFTNTTYLLVGGSGTGSIYIGNNATSNYARFHTNNVDTYFDMNCGDVLWRQASGTRFEHDMTLGTFTASGDIIAYGTPSDKRLKENIKPIESALDKVCKLQGVTFDWKKSDSILDIKQDIGFIAQDVQKVLPELVRENDNGMLSMRHQGIAPILLEAIKELKAEIEELKSKPCNCNK